jgi:ribonuclease BN (tRNA processing enzyme)
VRVTVLGKSPSWPDAGGACTGYLVQEGGYSLLLDCGTGVLAKLRVHLDYFAVDAVLITHLHSDHFFDLVPFSYALTLSPRREAEAREKPVLCVPPGARDVLRRMLGAWGNDELIESAFALSEYDPAVGVELGPLLARMREVPHFTRTFAVDVRGPGGRLTFGADCGPNDALVALARGTDLLIAEATLTEPEEGEPRGHLTAREAGEHGRRAGAQRLLVSHFSDELDPDWVRSEASAGFGGPVEVAHEGAVLDV